MVEILAPIVTVPMSNDGRPKPGVGVLDNLEEIIEFRNAEAPVVLQLPIIISDDDDDEPPLELQIISDDNDIEPPEDPSRPYNCKICT